MKTRSTSAKVVAGLCQELRANFLSASRLIVAACISCGVASAAQTANVLAAPGRTTLTGHTFRFLAGQPPLGHLPSTNTLSLAIGLPVRDPQALSDFIEQLYNPGSAIYRQYLTVEQFAERFGPSKQDYENLRAWVESQGLTVSGTTPNRMLLDVKGSVGDIEKAFQISLNTYQHPTENRAFYAPNVEPSVPAGLAVLDISGLNNFSPPRPMGIFKPLPNAGSSTNGSYIGKDFRTAYVPGVLATGRGQAVGLLQFDGYFPADIKRYAALAGLPDVPLQNVLLGGYDGVPSGNGGEVEVSLDIEMVISMAPQLSKVVVYSSGPFGVIPPNDMLNRMALDITVKQFSCSWGWNGGPNRTTDQIFQQMAAQGQSFFNATGDSDAFPAGTMDDPVAINQPSSNPYTTQVGGTTLTTGKGAVYTSERVWNQGLVGGSYFGSAGGISTYYSIPTWQQGVNMGTNGGSKTFRNIPDVALTADQVEVIADNGLGFAASGTSCAAPLWAGFMALVNQQGIHNTNPPIGFFNPILYAICATNQSAYFHDIVNGNNTNNLSKNLFFARPGYDLCTGWGSPKGDVLINFLAGPPTRDGIITLTVDPPSGSTLLSGSPQTISASVIDNFGITNATVVAFIPGVANLTFLDDGQAPDLIANDSVYSASLQVPATTNTITMKLIAIAPGELGSTNFVTYNIVPPPANDNFTNATKVASGGGFFLSNNRFATIETGEPPHFADSNVAASLWWVWTPDRNTNVLVDTTGSATNVILAAYTGTKLSTLTEVAATNGIALKHQPAYFRFNAQGGTAYHIAVASVNSNSIGSIQLRLAPGGDIDTTPPVVVITNPLSGITLTNRLITVSGTAADGGPAASGIASVNISANGGLTPAAITGTTNWSASVKLQQGLNSIDVSAIDNDGNVSDTATIQVNLFIQDPVNDFFAAAIPITSISPRDATAGSSSVISTNATKEVGEPNHAGNTGGKSVWWVYQAPGDGVLTLNTTNSSFDTLLALYTGTNVAALTFVDSNDDAYPDAPGGFSQIIHGVRANQVYHIAVDGYEGASGTTVLNYSFTGASVVHLNISNTAGGVVVPGSLDVSVGSTNVLTAVADPNFQFDGWTGDVQSTSNPLSVVATGDMNINAVFRLIAYSEGFESGTFKQLVWATAGDAPWIIQTNSVAAGTYAARSGKIGNSQSSSLILTTNFQAGNVSFSYRVSSETNWDFLGFYLDGAVVQQWSGEVDWAVYTLPIAAGKHTVEWRYTKDASLSAGLDAGFIDDVNLPAPPTGSTTNTAAVLTLMRATDGSYQIAGQGESNQHYITQSSLDLVTWQNISTNVAGAAGQFQVVDPAPPASKVRYYRAYSLLP